jgi:formylglycine-generating enzyme required for sulfatase activity
MMKRKKLSLLMTVSLVLVLLGCSNGTDSADPSDPTSPATVSDVTSANIGTLKAVEGGTFNNGTADMTVSSFRMSQYEVTRAQFSDIMGTDPGNASSSSGTSDPVQRTNWYHAIAFCNKLSIAESLTPVYTVTGIDFSTLTYASIPTTSNTTWDAATADWSANGYRLPTEAEWQFAARGGNSSNGYTYAGSDTIEDVAWYSTNSSDKTHPAGTKTANELGLYDMSGNVREWCWDWYDNYPTSAQSDYRGAASGSNRVRRGGSWYYVASGCTVAYRGSYYPYFRDVDVGFRVVRP